MKTKLVFVALGVIAALLLGNTADAGATDHQPDTNAEVATEEKADKKAEKVVTVKSGDTLEAIADAHDTTYVHLFNANPSITHPDVIDVGDKITIPAKDKEVEDRYSQLAAPAAPVTAVAQTETTYTTQEYTTAPVNSTSYYVGNGMWCTDYVHSKRPDVPIYGNAGYSWIGAAQAQGKATGSTPRAGAVAVMNGHVAYVESVNSDGSYVVSEMGWNYQAGNYNQRTVQPGTFGSFIY